jgi:hypothetical protein
MNNLLTFIGLDVRGELTIKLLVENKLASERQDLEVRTAMLKRAEQRNPLMVPSVLRLIESTQERIEDLENVLAAFKVSFMAEDPQLTENQVFALEGKIVARKDWRAD